MRSDVGSGAASTLILIGGVLGLTSLLFSAAAVFIQVDHAQALTDKAALEAADAASGRIAGYPCDRVDKLFTNTPFSLQSCTITDLVSRVVATATVLGFEVEVHAKAGPQILSQ